MVVLSAAICNNEGKAILSRQFMDIPKRKIEGLLLAFFNSLDPTSESNYIETENTRYLYLPIESLYVLLLTSIDSNIIEDLNTLTLLGKLIPEYCHAIDEDDIKENVYDLLLAIDEVVTSGHKEKLSLAQIRQITDMDSNEEKIFEAIERNKLNDAKSTSCKRAKEIATEKKKLKKEKGKNSFPVPQSFNIPDQFESDRIYVHEREKESKIESKEIGKSAMKLRKDNQDNHLIKQMEKAGELSLESIKLSSSSSSSSKQHQEELPHKEIHCEVVENLRLFMKSDGRIENFEVNGYLTLHITNPNLGRLRINFHSPSKSQFQFRGHPHLDKQKVHQNIVEMKLNEKSFSINTPVDILKWRFTSVDDADIPLIINCWPTQTGDSYTVNLEYELTATFLEFNDVQIFIPIPQGNQPVVENNDGTYEFIHKTSTLIWSVPQIDVSNSTGAMEFTVPYSGKPSSFFPIYVNFSSTKTYSQLTIDSVTDITTNQEVDYSRSVSFAPSNYDFKIDY